MTQAQIAKQAAKPAATKAAKPRTVRKPQAAKKAAPAKPSIAFIVEDYARPSGNRLKAFTAAWLDLTGMNKGKAIARADLVKIAGTRAIDYHTKNGNFAKTDAGLILSEKGQAAFGSRDIDPQFFAAYTEVFTTGANPEVLGIKNPAAIRKAA